MQALLPFFPHLLRRLPSGVFTMSSLLMLACLSPAMWHLWMDLESANANFFYAITLLWAAWQVGVTCIATLRNITLRAIASASMLATALCMEGGHGCDAAV